MNHKYSIVIYFKYKNYINHSYIILIEVIILECSVKMFIILFLFTRTIFKTKYSDKYVNKENLSATVVDSFNQAIPVVCFSFLRLLDCWLSKTI